MREIASFESYDESHDLVPMQEGLAMLQDLEYNDVAICLRNMRRYVLLIRTALRCGTQRLRSSPPQWPVDWTGLLCFRFRSLGSEDRI